MEACTEKRAVAPEGRTYALHWPSFCFAFGMEAGGILAFGAVSDALSKQGNWFWAALTWQLPMLVVGWLFLALPFLLNAKGGGRIFATSWIALALLRTAVLVLPFALAGDLDQLLPFVFSVFWIPSVAWMYFYLLNEAVREQRVTDPRELRFAPEWFYLCADALGSLAICCLLIPVETWQGVRSLHSEELAWAFPVFLFGGVVVAWRAAVHRHAGAAVRAHRMLLWLGLRAVVTFAVLSVALPQLGWSLLVPSSYVLGPVLFFVGQAGFAPCVYLYLLFVREPRPGAAPLKRSWIGACTAAIAEWLALCLGVLTLSVSERFLEDSLDSILFTLVSQGILISWLVLRLPLVLLGAQSAAIWFLGTVLSGLLTQLIFPTQEMLEAGFDADDVSTERIMVGVVSVTLAFLGSALYHRELLWRARAGMEH